MTVLPNPKLNHLSSVLPPAEWEGVAPQLTWADLPPGHVAYEPGDHPGYVHFPATSIVSLFYVTENGFSGKITTVGNEGMVDIAVFMGGETTLGHAVVQSAGGAYRLSARIFKQEFARAGAMQRPLPRYTQALITQMAQAAVCNRHYSIDQQLCRRFLLSLNRLPSSGLHMTQELIVNMLGMRRSGVTEIALELQTVGLIRYSHEAIEVLDHPGLERRVRECYTVVEREFDRLLPDLEVLRSAICRFHQESSLTSFRLSFQYEGDPQY